MVKAEMILEIRNIRVCVILDWLGVLNKRGIIDESALHMCFLYGEIRNQIFPKENENR